MASQDLPKILFKGHFKVNDTQIIFNETSSRKIDEELESDLMNDWEKMLEDAKRSNQKAWDSNTYRLENYTIDNSQLNLNLSTVKFSIRKCMKYHLDKIHQLGQDYYSNGLFVSAVIITDDIKFLLGRVSKTTLNLNTFDFIGGVASRDEIKVYEASDLFNIVFKELEEEVNLQKSFIKNSEIIGAILTLGLQISLVFKIELNISSEKLKSLYLEKNDNEIDELLFFTQSDFVEEVKKVNDYKSLVPELL